MERYVYIFFLFVWLFRNKEVQNMISVMHEIWHFRSNIEVYRLVQWVPRDPMHEVTLNLYVESLTNLWTIQYLLKGWTWENLGNLDYVFTMGVRRTVYLSVARIGPVKKGLPQIIENTIDYNITHTNNSIKFLVNILTSQSVILRFLLLFHGIFSIWYSLTIKLARHKQILHTVCLLSYF